LISGIYVLLTLGFGELNTYLSCIHVRYISAHLFLS
jgi:hypothetical protein